MSGDETQRDRDKLPGTNSVTNGEVIDELEDQFDEDSSEGGMEDANLKNDADKDESGKAGKKTSKVVVRKTAKAPIKKTAAARKHFKTEHGEHGPYRAKNPTQLVCQSVTELRKVVWPSWRELTALFSAVLLFVPSIIAYVMPLDSDLGWALLSLFGGDPR